MPVRRVWDSSCPHIYDKWESDGVSWVIQDLEPQDDDTARNLLLAHLCPDEALCMASGMTDEEDSMISMGEYWRHCLALRTSLACYIVEDNKKTLAAVNCCLIVSADDNEKLCKVEGKAWQNVYNALQYAETKANAFQILNLDTLLYGMGLVVNREYRGAKLGARVLAAREPLALAQGVQGTSTVFTGVASQKSALRAGFTTIAEVTFKQLSEAGLNYPHEDKSIKLMVKRFGR